MWILYASLPHHIRNAVPLGKAEITFSPAAIGQKEEELRTKMEMLDFHAGALSDMGNLLMDAGPDLQSAKDAASDGRKKAQHFRLQLTKLLEMLPYAKALVNGEFVSDVRIGTTLEEVRAYTAGETHV